MNFNQIKTLLLMVTALIGGAATAQMTGDEITDYSSEITKGVIAALTQAAEKKMTDAGEFQRFASEIAPPDKGAAQALDIQTALYCHLCDAPAGTKKYMVRLKDILFPKGTGPTYPNDVIVTIRQLQKSSEYDFQLDAPSHAQITAALNAMIEFIQSLQSLHDKYPAFFDGAAASTDNAATSKTNADACTSWWCKWGKCAAGILGGAVTGGLVGALGGSAVPVVGTVVGGVAGAVGGALTGAATFCYQNLDIWRTKSLYSFS